MDIKKLNENPTIADKIIIDIETPDADGCFLENPYKVDNVTIYYVHRSYGGNNYSQYDKKIYDDDLKTKLDAAIVTACDAPTDENLAEVEKLRTQLDTSALTETFYYTDAEPVAIFGTDDTPAWLTSTPSLLDNDNFLVNIEKDENGNDQYGKFELAWNPVGLREGDYFVCWTWMPNIAGDSLNNCLHFTLLGSTQITTSIPTHFTKPEKYETLLERYLPEMFKLHLGSGDLSPEVFQEFNGAVAKGFTFIEDLANQIVDLIDGNATHESLLPLLGSMFNLQLKTGDPTLWRRQIKNAIPLYKKKGTYSGLSEALNQIGVKLTRFAQLWQVVSKYTYQESFVVENNGDDSFILFRTAILPVDVDNFELYLREADSDEWATLDDTYVDLENDSNITTMTWTGAALSAGDEVRVVYKVAAVPGVPEQDIEDYIRTLPLADQRDERDQDYPLKNWNVRVIEDDDPLLSSVIPTRHPYYDDLIYGRIRTEFPYSENVYNMDEYNGSTRDSYDPCDIDKDFLDGCSSCLGSKFAVDLEIENISYDRILESQDVIRNYVPFHSVLHSLNLSGAINELIPPPLESLDILVTYIGTEFTISGNAQTIFNRSMENSAQFKRDELANATTEVSSASGTGYNEQIALFSPDASLENLPLDSDSNYNHLEVLAPSPNVGDDYTIENADRNHAFLASNLPSESPLNQSAFTFRLSNERARENTSVDIYQDDVFKFSDENFDFWKQSIKTQWDGGAAWIVEIPAYTPNEYEVINIIDGVLILANDLLNPLPTSGVSGITYTLKDDGGEEIHTGSTGSLSVRRRGRVDLGTTINIRGDVVTLNDVRDLMDSYHGNGENHYFKYSGSEYAFDGFVEGSTSEFYVAGYTGGLVGGATPIRIYQRLLNNKKGYFHYQGLKLETLVDHEGGLEINNGENPPIEELVLEDSHFKENYLILIDTNYYAITKIDGTTIWLSGPDQTWTTTGTPVTYDILRYEKSNPDPIPESDYPPMPGHDFNLLDRRGNEVITGTILEGGEEETVSAFAMQIGPPSDLIALTTALNAANQGKVIETVNQKEGITFSIETKQEKNE